MVEEITEWLKSVQEEYTQDTATMTDAEFAALFRSDSFESLFKSNNTAVSIELPYAGELFKFGASNDYAKSWEKWHREKNSNEWKFSERTNTKITFKRHDPDVVKIIADIARTLSPENHYRTIQIESQVDFNAVRLEITWHPFVQDGTTSRAPSITSISGGGFSFSAASPLIGKTLDSSTKTIVLPWAEGASFGTVCITLDQSPHFATEIFNRPMGFALIEYDYIEKQGYEKIGDISDIFKSNRGRGEHKGNWKDEGWQKENGCLETCTRGRISVAGLQRLTNVTARIISGHDGWADKPQDNIEISTDRKSATTTVNVGGPNCTVELKANVEEWKTHWSRERSEVRYAGSSFEFTIQASAVDPLLTVLANNQVFRVKPGDSSGAVVLLERRVAGGDDGTITYKYTLKP